VFVVRDSIVEFSLAIVEINNVSVDAWYHSGVQWEHVN